MCICLSNMKKEREVWTDFSSQTRGNAVETFPLSRWVNDKEGLAQLRDHSHCKSQPNHTHIYKTKEYVCTLSEVCSPCQSRGLSKPIKLQRYFTHVPHTCTYVNDMKWGEIYTLKSGKMANFLSCTYGRTTPNFLSTAMFNEGVSIFAG